MTNHFIEDRVLEPLRYFLPFTIAFYASLVCIRIYEYIAASALHVLPDHAWKLEVRGMLYDLVYALHISLLVLIPFGMFNYVYKRLGRIYNNFMLIVLLILYAAIVQYFITALVPLGSDFWGYSLDDMSTTVGASGGLGFKNLFPLFAIASLGCLFYYLSHRFVIHSTWASYLYLFMLVGSLLFNPWLPKSEQYESELDYALVENKGRFFIIESIEHFFEKKGDPNDTPLRPYPLLHKVNYEDRLGAFFNFGTQKPNFVFIQVEGLGKSFMGENADQAGFTPFLDSLSREALFWENFLSTTGRTFGILPSMYGSLPYCKEGFMEMGTSMPAHESMISLLKREGYTANYFYGGNSNFDKQDIFLERQGIDLIMDEYDFPDSIRKMPANKEGFTWGYGDKDVFSYSLQVLDLQEKTPRIDMYMTLTTHEPFKVPDPAYKKRFDQLAAGFPASRQKELMQYRGVFECLLYTDDAIRQLLTDYQKRPEYAHTIFIITGDHRMIPIPHASRIDRFHVPFLIWSPMLKQRASFRGISSHADVAPTLLAMLQQNFGLKFPDEMPFLGQMIDTSSVFSGRIELPIMPIKGDISHLVMGEYFYADGALFRINDNMRLKPVSDDAVKKQAEGKLENFKKINLLVCEQDQLYKAKPNAPKPNQGYTFTLAEQKYIEQSALNKLGADEKFFTARKMAFEGNYTQAIIILKHTLNYSPNYSDVRILLGRIYIWNEELDNARKELEEALRRSPQYHDAYVALIDCEIKAANYEQARKLAERALRLHPDEKQLLEQKRQLDMLP